MHSVLRCVRSGVVSSCLLSLVACGGGAGEGGSPAPRGPSPAPPPSVSLSSSLDGVDLGGSVTLTWSSANATSCTASGAWSGSKSISGSEAIAALNDNSEFKLSCTGAGGTANTTRNIAINAPQTTFAASRSPVPTGSAVWLSWSSINATACTASGGWTGSQPLTGAHATLGLSNKTTFGLSCGGPGGTSTRTVTVDVSDIAVTPTLTLAVDKAVVPQGKSVTLSWSSSQADECNTFGQLISGSWDDGPLATSGTRTVGPLARGTYTFGVQCFAASRSVTVTRSVSVAVTGPEPLITFTAQATSVPSGGSTVLGWDSQNAKTCQASGAWTGSLALFGSQKVGPLTGPAEFVITCTGDSGSTTARLDLKISSSLVLVPTTVDPTLSQTAVQTISEVVSAVDSQPYGSAITIPVASPRGRTLVMALDGSGEVFLAGFAKPGEAARFDVPSTARLLVLLALGSARFDGLTTADVDSLITNAAQYAPLIRQMTAAVNAGVSPLDVPAVRMYLIDLVKSIAPAIAAAEARVTLSSKSRQVIARKDLVLPLPYPIIGTGTEAGSVYVSGPAPGGTTNVVNRSWIAWNARSRSVVGDAAGESKILGAAGKWDLLLTPPDPVAVPGSGVDSRLEVYQDVRTKTINVANVLVNSGLLALDFLVDTKDESKACLVDGLTGLVTTKANLIEFIAVDHSGDSTLEFLKAIVPSAVGEAGNLALSCGLDIDAGDVIESAARKWAPKFAGVIGAAFAAYEIAQRIADAANLAGAVIQTIKHWNASLLVTVCRVGDEIQACVRALRFTKTLYAVELGGSVFIEVEAVDERGQVIKYPPALSLSWTSSDPNLVALDSVTTSVLSNVARPAAMGGASITVKDAVSGLTAQTDVQVGIRRFRYESAVLSASGSVGGVPLPVPGPVVVEIMFDRPIVSGFSGVLSAENIESLTIRSQGVGEFSGTGLEIDALTPQVAWTESAFYPIHVTFTSGIVTSWRLFIHGLQQYGSCSGGTNYIAINTVNEHSNGRIYEEDGALAECDNPPQREIYITGRDLNPESARWQAVQ